MRRQTGRSGRSPSRDGSRTRRWRRAVTVVGVLCVVSLGVAAAALEVVSVAAGFGEPSSQVPSESEFFGLWCSSSGDRLDLTDGRFSVDPMSPALAGQIAFFLPTPDPGRSHHWDDPPATAAAGTWSVSVLGPDLLSDQVTAIRLSPRLVDGEAAVGDDLELSAARAETGWQLSLTAKPAGSGEMAFVRCAEAK